MNNLLKKTFLALLCLNFWLAGCGDKVSEAEQKEIDDLENIEAELDESLEEIDSEVEDMNHDVDSLLEGI